MANIKKLQKKLDKTRSGLDAALAKIDEKNTRIGNLQGKLEYGRTGGFAGALARSTDPVAIAHGIVSEDSTLMQGARTRGAQEANRRGLINSTIAGQAQEAAMMDFALPLAQARADSNQRSELLDFEREKFGFEREKFGEEKKNRIEDQAYRYQALYQNTVANIMANPNLSKEERTRQIEAAEANLGTQLNMVEKMMGVDIPWPKSGSSDSEGSSSGGSGSSGSGESRWTLLGTVKAGGARAIKVRDNQTGETRTMTPEQWERARNS